MKCPKAIGTTKTATGFKPVLVNKNQKSFIVDPKVFIVWSLCNGKNSIDQIREKFESKLGIDKKGARDLNVNEIIRSLERIGLIERSTILSAN